MNVIVLFAVKLAKNITKHGKNMFLIAPLGKVGIEFYQSKHRKKNIVSLKAL